MQTKTALTGLVLAASVGLPGPAWPEGNRCNEPFLEVLDDQPLVDNLIPEQYRVIDNETDWCSFFWEATWRPCDTALVDFGSEVAVVAAIGERPHTGFDVEITCIKRPSGSDDLSLDVVEFQFGEGAQTPIAPFHVVKVDRPVGRVKFLKKTQGAKHNCNEESQGCVAECDVLFEECIADCHLGPVEPGCESACRATQKFCRDICRDRKKECQAAA